MPLLVSGGDKPVNRVVEYHGGWCVVAAQKVSYLVVFGALSRMVKVRGACDKPFWVCKRLNKLRRPRAGKLMTFYW